ncbi:MAG: hypothetical protein R6U98_14380 [Pirellulaceae bacterium]
MESCPTQAVLPLVGLAAEKVIRDRYIFQAVGFFRVEGRPTQAVLPLVGLAAEKVIRDRYKISSAGRRRDGSNVDLRVGLTRIRPGRRIPVAASGKPGCFTQIKAHTLCPGRQSGQPSDFHDALGRRPLVLADFGVIPGRRVGRFGRGPGEFPRGRRGCKTIQLVSDHHDSPIEAASRCAGTEDRGGQCPLFQAHHRW